MSPHERFELIDHLARCQALLGMLRDPEARLTLENLITYLEAKIAALSLTERVALGWVRRGRPEGQGEESVDSVSPVLCFKATTKSTRLFICSWSSRTLNPWVCSFRGRITHRDRSIQWNHPAFRCGRGFYVRNRVDVSRQRHAGSSIVELAGGCHGSRWAWPYLIRYSVSASSGQAFPCTNATVNVLPIRLPSCVSTQTAGT